MYAKCKRCLLFNCTGTIWSRKTHSDPTLFASEWESLMVSKGHSIWGCSTFLKHRNQQVQIHTEEIFWKWIAAHMKEVEKRPVTCQGGHGSCEWMQGWGVLFQSKEYVISQTYWIEYRPAWMAWVAVHQNSLQTKCFFAYVCGLLLHHYWTEFSNPHTLSVNFCSSLMLFYYSALECFSLPCQTPPNRSASTSLSQSHGRCLQPLRLVWIPCFILPEPSDTPV